MSFYVATALSSHGEKKKKEKKTFYMFITVTD